MGSIIDIQQIPSIQELFHLLIYCKGETECPDVVSVNRLLSEKLIKLKPFRRTMQLEKCFNEIITSIPTGSVVKDFDVMFNPDYKVDVLKILIAANKQHPISIIWPGRYSDGKLIYSEESLPDYKVYDINDYDVYCVI